MEPISLNPPRGVRIVKLSDGTIEMRVKSLWLWSLLLLFGSIIFLFVFVVGQRPSAVAFMGSIVAITVLFFAVLHYWDGGGSLTRAWRFGPGRLRREALLPLPDWLFRHDFHVDEFEIVHAIFTKGLFNRSLQGGHQDSLRFWAGGRSKVILVRGLSDSLGTLRGGLFTQHHAGEIEREILPDVLSVAFLAAGTVGVPLYVIEKTYWVGVSDSDG